jgi:hypothetical protein
LVFSLAFNLSLTGCSTYQAPSSQGYDYDRGRATARSDIRSGRLGYFVSGPRAERLAAESASIASNCGFSVRRIEASPQPAESAVQFARGYNSVSVPAIEQRLGATIGELLRRCTGSPREAD